MQIEISGLAKAYGGEPAIRDFTATFPRGRITVMLGPSGCGKTTVLRSIAGLERPNSGEIRIGNRLIFSAADRVDTEPQRRNIGMVFQSYALWPHLTVRENVSFALQVAKVAPSALRKRVDWALELVQLGPYHARLPGQLSGGQQQRVALARALAGEPAVLLLDEPLSNLDAKLRESVRLELRALQQRLEMTMVYVTHDQTEALVLGDHVVLMQGGRIAQQGTPEELYDRPCDGFTAQFIGQANLLPATVLAVEGSEVVAVPAADSKPLRLPAVYTPEVGEEALIMLRPEDLRIDVAADWPQWVGVVRQRVLLGNRFGYIVRIAGDHEIQVEADRSTVVPPGATVALSLAPGRRGLLLPAHHTAQAGETA